MTRRRQHISSALFSGMALLSLSAPLAAAPLPEQVTLTYRVHLGETRLGVLVTELRKINDGYEVRAETRAEGMAAILLGGTVRETCRFRTDAGKIVPSSYLRVREGLGGGTNNTVFDWQQGRITFADGSLERIPQGYVIDSCSVPFAYMRDGRDGFQKRTLHIVGHKRIRHYDLASISRETLKTPLGELEVLRIEHVRQGSEKRFIVWLAVQRDYLPVKIVEKRKSRTTSMIAEKVEGIP